MDRAQTDEHHAMRRDSIGQRAGVCPEVLLAPEVGGTQ